MNARIDSSNFSWCCGKVAQTVESQGRRSSFLSLLSYLIYLLSECIFIYLLNVYRCTYIHREGKKKTWNNGGFWAITPRFSWQEASLSHSIIQSTSSGTWKDLDEMTVCPYALYSDNFKTTINKSSNTLGMSDLYDTLWHLSQLSFLVHQKQASFGLSKNGSTVDNLHYCTTYCPHYDYNPTCLCDYHYII